VVSEGARVLGVIRLKDIVKGGMRERFAELRKMGIKTIMITGDNPVTAAAIAATPGHAQGVARKHGWDVMRKYDDPQKVVGITNGANLKWSAGLFWDYLQEVGHENADRLRPTAEQARDAKRLAKERFFTDLLVHPQHVEEQFYRRFRYILNDPAKRGEPTPALDPTLLAQPTVGFVGRLVNEKFNMGRGWTTRNIEELVKAGYNVVLFAPIQQKSDPTSPSAAMARTLEALSGNLDREWRPGHGRFPFFPIHSLWHVRRCKPRWICKQQYPSLHPQHKSRQNIHRQYLAWLLFSSLGHRPRHFPGS
jgi:hypothetical protein